MTSERSALGLVRTLLIIVAVLVIAAGIVTARAVATYDPLEAGTTSRYPGARLVEPVETGELETYDLPYQHGREGDLFFSVRNSGRWGVKIIDFPILHHRVFSLIKFAAVEVGDTSHQERPSVRFTPFILRSGEERLIRLRGVFTDCDHYEALSGNAFESFQVRYRFLWSTRTANIPLPARLKVTSPPNEGCPLQRPAPEGQAPEGAPPLPTNSP